jgi:predicted phage replisome organizer
MADIKWIKLNTNMHEDEKMRLIDAMPERDTIHYLWIRLLIQAGKTNANGLIYLNENISYTDEMLSTLFCRPLASIRLAFKILSDFQMIEIDDNNVIKIINWERHQNVEGMDRVRDQNRKRVQNHREKKKQLESAAGESEEISTEIEEPIIEAGNNNCDIIKNSSNVTEDKSNVTVTEQNKRETKNKKEIKNENKKERENENTCDKKKNLNSKKSEEVKTSVSQSNSNIKLSSDTQPNGLNAEFNKNLEDITTKCAELIKYAETITGIPNVLNFGALRLAISMHGHKYVKMAIDVALKANKPNMTYIDGILKNWRREGYPEDKEVKKNVTRSYGKNSNPDKNEFAGFKPKKPRSLTAEERRKAEQTLI